VAIKQTGSQPAFDGLGIQEHFTLTLSRDDKQAKLNIALFRPAEPGPHPIIIKNCRVLFDVGSDAGLARMQQTAAYDLDAASEAIKRGYILCKFTREQLARDQKGTPPNGVQLLYPEYDWGTIAIWAWGHGVVLDVLDRMGYADMGKVVATGHSRGGQTAIAAGIFDERIAVVVPCTGGYGSCGTLRIRDPEGVRGTEDIIETYLIPSAPHWHTPRYHEYAGHQNKLPFDAHTLVGLIAPRPLLNTNATEDPYNNTLSIEAGIHAGRLVYDWLGYIDACSLHWRPGTHAQKEEDWRALLDYSDAHFFSQKGESKFNRWVHPEFRPPVTWACP